MNIPKNRIYFLRGCFIDVSICLNQNVKQTRSASLTLQETRGFHDSMNIQNIEFIP